MKRRNRILASALFTLACLVAGRAEAQTSQPVRPRAAVDLATSHPLTRITGKQATTAPASGADQLTSRPVSLGPNLPVDEQAELRALALKYKGDFGNPALRVELNQILERAKARAAAKTPPAEAGKPPSPGSEPQTSPTLATRPVAASRSLPAIPMSSHAPGSLGPSTSQPKQSIRTGSSRPITDGSH